MPSFDLTFPGAPSRTCPVHVGPGALERLVGELARGACGAVAVVSDDRVAPLHGEPLRARLAAAGLDAHLLTFPEGERSKTLATVERLHVALAATGAGRDACVVAVGGGVTGDLAGFVAATWHRGVSFRQAPTSLLAMVDAAIGGKNGVDLAAGKNLVGAFHQPDAVHADPAVLATLPDAAYRHGLAEAVKTAAVADAALFGRLESERAALLARGSGVVEEVVAACARRKGEIVVRDERDGGARAALNFGHTVGHAIEAASGFAVAHGDAVAIGMLVEADLAERATGFPASDRARLAALLRSFGLPSAPPATVATPALVRAAALDKKARGGRIRCALPAGLGCMPESGATTVAVDAAALAAAVDRARAD